MRSWGWFILKFSSERSVWAPQYLSDGTWISPKASLSVRVLAILLVTLKWRRWNAACVFNGVYRAVESGRALRVQLNEGLAFAYASDRNAPASAARSLVALRNMIVASRGGRNR